MFESGYKYSTVQNKMFKYLINKITNTCNCNSYLTMTKTETVICPRQLGTDFRNYFCRPLQCLRGRCGKTPTPKNYKKNTLLCPNRIIKLKLNEIYQLIISFQTPPFVTKNKSHNYWITPNRNQRRGQRSLCMPLPRLSSILDYFELKPAGQKNHIAEKTLRKPFKRKAYGNSQSIYVQSRTVQSKSHYRKQTFVV